MSRVNRLLASVGFAWFWVFLIFAFYGGMVRGVVDASTFWGSFLIGYVVVTAAGYNLGSVKRDRFYRHLVADLIRSNHGMAKALMEKGTPCVDEEDLPFIDGTAYKEDDDDLQPPKD